MDEDAWMQTPQGGDIKAERARASFKVIAALLLISPSLEFQLYTDSKTFVHRNDEGKGESRRKYGE
jgi:hypothetical protein